jgi:hypothetical protein
MAHKIIQPTGYTTEQQNNKHSNYSARKTIISTTASNAIVVHSDILKFTPGRKITVLNVSTLYRHDEIIIILILFQTNNRTLTGL